MRSINIEVHQNHHLTTNTNKTNTITRLQLRLLLPRLPLAPRRGPPLLPVLGLYLRGREHGGRAPDPLRHDSGPRRTVRTQPSTHILCIASHRSPNSPHDSYPTNTPHPPHTNQSTKAHPAVHAPRLRPRPHALHPQLAGVLGSLHQRAPPPRHHHRLGQLRNDAIHAGSPAALPHPPAHHHHLRHPLPLPGLHRHGHVSTRRLPRLPRAIPKWRRLQAGAHLPSLLCPGVQVHAQPHHGTFLARGVACAVFSYMLDRLKLVLQTPP